MPFAEQLPWFLRHLRTASLSDHELRPWGFRAPQSIAFLRMAGMDGVMKSSAPVCSISEHSCCPSRSGGRQAVSLPSRARWLDEFLREILASPAGRDTDQVDAFSQALNRAFNRRRGEVSSGFVRGLYSGRNYFGLA